MDCGQDHFLTSEERSALRLLVRERKVANLKARRANALLLLDDGLSALDVARVLYLDDETIRSWKRGFEKDGLGSLDLKAYAKRDGHLTADQEAKLSALFRRLCGSRANHLQSPVILQIQETVFPESLCVGRNT